MIKKIKLTKTSLSVFAILASAFFLRVYRINTLLGFYYDQGRDALVIWDFVYNGKFFLIGPTTGIEGIFRGPWYYWLITPFYWLGRGNPVWPTVFLSFTTIIAVYLLYVLTLKSGGKWAGITALIIGSFSFSFVNSSHWLSNPTPMYLVSMVFVWSLFRILDGKLLFWIVALFTAGMAMQFGSAAEVFYLPFLLVFALINKKLIPGIKIITASVFVFLFAFIPQIIFNIRHNGVLAEAVNRFLFENESFKLSFWQILGGRLNFYIQTFSELISPNTAIFFYIILPLAFAGMYFSGLKYWREGKRSTILLLLLTVLLGMLFFQGNQGNVYAYYFTGYYFVFVIFISLILGKLAMSVKGKLVLVLFLLFFLLVNSVYIYRYLKQDPNASKDIVLGNQLSVIDWIYKDAQGKEFNLDVYVPPVIPYAYQYLFLWQSTTKYGYQPDDDQSKLLYTVYEYDFFLPSRHENWLKRQDGIGKVIYEAKFGNVYVQKRERI